MTSSALTPIDVKKTVFISSTFTDLTQYRNAVWTLLESFNVSVKGMEAFGARKETSLDTCLIELEQSNIYVGIIGFRLGSVHPQYGKSFTQIEYERAVELKKEILIYLADPDNSLFAPTFVDRGENAEKLDAFKAALKDSHTVDFFTTIEDLAAKLGRAIRRLSVPSRAVEAVLDESFAANKVLQQFALAPKSVAGQHVRLKLRKTDDAFAASKTLCEAFNFEYGNAIVVPVEIINPNGCQSIGLDHVFASGKRVAELLSITEAEQFDIYVAALFSATEVDSMRARFTSESYSYYENNAVFRTTPVHEIGLKRVHHKAEGTIGLLYIRST